ncbi:hypothetical protein L6164_019821 [Bauhinia variegata]|uniref:Uncharacterized protein n=1 Tax=Bauhinia variegata TaxID=167791 RepID=A0ACB9MUD7_BAUVA|nr:hypothetical protein L6164_019821 [Bauhinia variegata]
MAHMVAVVVEGVADFVRTLWSLQERRCSITFNMVSSALLSVTMALMLCFLSIHTQTRGDMVHIWNPQPDEVKEGINYHCVLY